MRSGPFAPRLAAGLALAACLLSASAAAGQATLEGQDLATERELADLEHLAEEAFAEDDLQAAAALYRQLAERQSVRSEKSRVMVIVAYLELQLRRKADAIATVRDALISDPDYRFEAESYGDAMREVFYEGQKAAIAERQRLADRSARLGAEQMRQGDNGAARRHFETALGYRPDHASALYNLALTHLNDRREEDAEAGFQKLLALGETSGQLRSLAMINLGYLYQRRRLYQEAADILQQAVAIDPSSAQAWSNLGAARRQMGERAAAAEAFRRAYELEPGNAEALGNLALADIDAGNWQGAVALLEKATAADPRNANRWLLLGRARLGTGDTTGAVAALESAIRLDPGDAGGWASNAAVQLARHYYSTGAYQLALAQADRALAWRRDLVTARIYQGLAREELGDLSGARQSLEEARRLEPTRAATYNNLGSVYYQLGLFDEAVESLQRALAIQPDFPDARANLQAVREGRSLARSSPTTSSSARPSPPPATPSRTPRLGVRFADIDYAALGLKGAMVERVEAGGPAARSGLAKNDLILKIDGRDVTDAEALRRYVASRPIGSSVTLSLLRANAPVRVDVRLD